MQGSTSPCTQQRDCTKMSDHGISRAGVHGGTLRIQAVVIETPTASRSGWRQASAGAESCAMPLRTRNASGTLQEDRLPGLHRLPRYPTVRSSPPSARAVLAHACIFDPASSRLRPSPNKTVPPLCRYGARHTPLARPGQPHEAWALASDRTMDLHARTGGLRFRAIPGNASRVCHFCRLPVAEHTRLRALANTCWAAPNGAFLRPRVKGRAVARPRARAGATPTKQSAPAAMTLGEGFHWPNTGVIDVSRGRGHPETGNVGESIPQRGSFQHIE